MALTHLHSILISILGYILCILIRLRLTIIYLRDLVLSTASRKTGVSLFECLSSELLPPESSVAEVLSWEGLGVG